MAYVRRNWEKEKTDLNALNLNNVEEGVYELDKAYYDKLKELDGVAPKGPTGKQGPDGDPGETGAQGDDGDDGDPGNKGETGDRGVQGADGDQGGVGDPGDEGDIGATGAKGLDGDQGDKGSDFDINQSFAELENKSIVVSLNELYDSVGVLQYGYDKGESQADNSHIIYPSKFMNVKVNSVFKIKSTALKNLDFSTTADIATYFEITKVNEGEVSLKCIKALDANKIFKFKATTTGDTATEISYSLSVSPSINITEYKTGLSKIDKTYSRQTVNIYDFKPGVNVKIPLIGTDGNLIAKPVKGKDFLSTEIDPKVILDEQLLSVSTGLVEANATYVLKIFFTEDKSSFCTVNIHTGSKA